MAQTSSDAPRQQRIGMAVSSALDVLAQPFAALARPLRRFGANTDGAGAGPTGAPLLLTDPAHANRIAFFETPIDRSAEIREKTEAHIRALVAMDDWSGLAETMAELDRTCAACPDGTRLIFIALDVVTDYFAKGYYEAGVSIPTQVAAIDRMETDRLCAIAAAHPTHYALTAIAAHFLLQNAWEYRGAALAGEVPEDRWDAACVFAAQAADILDPFVVSLPNSPLLAYLEFCQLPFDLDGHRNVHVLYREWAELDPDNQLAHQLYGFFLLPRWFGDTADFDQYLRKAALENRGESGAAAYASAYLFMATTDRFAVHHMDVGLFAEGVIALAEQSDNDPCVVAEIVQAVQALAHFESHDSAADGATVEHLERTKAGLVALRDRLLRTHLTAVSPAAWTGGTTEALNCLSLALQAELATSATFVLDQNGLTVQEDSA